MLQWARWVGGRPWREAQMDALAFVHTMRAKDWHMKWMYKYIGDGGAALRR